MNFIMNGLPGKWEWGGFWFVFCLNQDTQDVQDEQDKNLFLFQNVGLRISIHLFNNIFSIHTQKDGPIGHGPSYK